MTDQEQREVFAKNLVDILSERNETQKEVADAMGVSPQVINTWCKAIALPRMGKVQRLAAHLDVPVNRLLDRQIPPEPPQAVKHTLTARESEILAKWRVLGDDNRDIVEATMNAMLEKKTNGMEDDVDVG